MKHFLSLLLLTALLTGALPTFVLAESGSSSDDQVVEGGDPDDDTNDVDQGDDDDDDDDDSSTDSSDDDDDDKLDESGDDDDDKVESEIESDEDVEEDEDIDEDMEDELDDLVEDVLESEGEVDSSEGGDETVLSEEVDESDLSDEMQDELEEAVSSGKLPDSFYLSVQWGLFPTDLVVGDSGTETVWTGSVVFEDDDSTSSLIARPYKLVRFEKDQDSVDFDTTTSTETDFDSSIYVHNDGILFKVRTDLTDTSTKVVFNTAYQNTQLAVSVADLLTNESVQFTIGEYTVVMKVWSREDWVGEHSKHRGDDSEDSEDDDNEDRLTNPSDADETAWYGSFMNYSLDLGIFQGYKGSDGELTGKIGPGDSLTRFQLLKVLVNLAETLELGVGTTSCDTATNTTNTETDWMEGHWARGYVQCALDSGLSITLLNEVINEDLATGEKPTLRWEVLVTAAELMGLDIPSISEVPSDVEDADLDEDEKDSIGYFYDLGVVSGYPDGSFKPEQKVNRAEMFKIVILLLESLGL